MKNISLLFLSILLVVGTGCQGDDDPNVSDYDTVQVTVDNDEEYTYDMGMMGIEDQVTITKRPAHAKKSQVTRNTEDHVVYYYQANDGYTGNDAVTLQVCISNGAKCVSNRIITLKIKVTD